MKKKIKKPKQVDRSVLAQKLPQNRGEWLELVIKFTKRAMDSQPEKYLQNQIDRLTQELNTWRKNES